MKPLLPPYDRPTAGPLWDDRFMLSRMALGVAASCWVLACLLMVAFPPSLVPPALVPIIPAVALASLVMGRFDRLTMIGTVAVIAASALGWWLVTTVDDSVVLLLSAVLAVGLAFRVFWQTGQDDHIGLWRDTQVLFAALACCTVAAFGLWGVALWAMREFKQTGHPGINGFLLWGWMFTSLWCTQACSQALKVAQEAVPKGSLAKDELADRQATVLLGVMFIPWGLGAATLFFEAASQGPFDQLLYPEKTTPLWISVVPLVIAISAINAGRVLHSMLRAPRYADVQMPPAQTPEAPSL